jgi:hypothetical protein
MTKITVFIAFLLLAATNVWCQKVNGKLKFEQGQIVQIMLQVKTNISQEAMGQAIDFNLDGNTAHSYKVTNSTKDNTTLHHQVQQIAFKFDGMGQKRSFDSHNEKDINGQFGKPIRELLTRTFDMIIDPAGKVLMVQPEKTDTAKMDDRMAIIASMLKDILDIVQPPQKGGASFFKVLPDAAINKGDHWTESTENKSGKLSTSYTLSDITDSTIVVSFMGNSVTTNKAQMMGNETTTTMNNKITGKIILDKGTGIIREKTINIDSNGSMGAMGGTMPVTSKSTTVIRVK